MKKIFTYLLFFIITNYATQAFAQVKFYSSQKNIGTIQPNGDILKINYPFKNESEQPIAISRIIPSCGCTIPHFEKKPIQSGQQGNILISFNPAGINGFFKKQISVYFSNSPRPIQLYLSGKVISTNDLKPGYHYAIGALQFRNIRSSLQATAGQTTMRTFPLLNTSSQTIKVTLSSNIKGLYFEENTFTLAPNEHKELSVYFSPEISETIHIRIIKGQVDKQKIALKIILDL